MSVIENQLADLIERNSALFAQTEKVIDGQVMQIAGTLDDPASFNAEGGKTGDLGYYPMVTVSGDIVYRPCLARMQALGMVEVDHLQDDLDLRPRVDAPQGYSEAQKAQGRANLGALGRNAPGGTPISFYVDPAQAAPADWGPVIRQAMLDLGGRKLQLERGAVYYVANPISIGTDIALDLNEATIIAPRGFLSARGDRVSFQGGALFDAVEGRSFFTPNAAVRAAIVAGTVKRGDVLQFESDTVRVASGGYLYGQVSRFVRYDAASDRVYIDRAFYASFRVDRLRVRLPLNIGVANGTVDISGAQQVSVGNPTVGITALGDNVRYEAIKVIGGDYAGQGLAGEGMRVVMIDCRADGILDRGGIPGGGRIGYGFAGAGDEWTLVRCSASGCKHNFSASSRIYQTRIVRVIDFTGHIRADGMAETLQTQGGPVEAAYQAQADCHANVTWYFLIRPQLDGPNNLVAVRNGHVLIDAPIFRSRGMNENAQTPHLISIYEEQLRDALVRDALIRVDAQNGAMPYFIGVDGFGFANRRVAVHGLEISPAGTGDIGLCNIKGNASPEIGNLISIDMIDFQRVRGRFADGIVVGGNGTMAGVGTIIFEADAFTMIDKAAVYHQAFVRVAPSVGYFNKLRMRGTFDGSAALGASTGAGSIEMGSPTTNNVLPKELDIQAAITWPYQFLYAATTSTVPIGGWKFDGTTLSYGTVARGNENYAVYVAAPAIPTTFTTFQGATFIGGPAASQPIRFVGRGLVKLDGFTTNVQPYFNGDRSPIPVGFRRVNGLRWVLWPNYEVDWIGNLYSLNTPPADGNDALIPNGTVVRRVGLVAGQSPGWVNVGVAPNVVWKALPPIAA